jgi:hypothetical protein
MAADIYTSKRHGYFARISEILNAMNNVSDKIYTNLYEYHKSVNRGV